MSKFIKQFLITVTICVTALWGASFVSAISQLNGPSVSPPDTDTPNPSAPFLTPINTEITSAGIQTVEENSFDFSTEDKLIVQGVSRFENDVSVGTADVAQGATLRVLGGLKIGGTGGANGSLKMISGVKDIYLEDWTTSSTVSPDATDDTCDHDITNAYVCDATDRATTYESCTDYIRGDAGGSHYWRARTVRCASPEQPSFTIENVNGSLEITNDNGDVNFAIDKDGNVGIGTDNLTTFTDADGDKVVLTVNGLLHTTNDVDGEGGILFSGGKGQTKTKTKTKTRQTGLDAGAISGAIMFFNMTSCPSGWSEPAGGIAHGRYLLGLPSNATQDEVGVAPANTVALTDKENRATGEHRHRIQDDGHRHQYQRRKGTDNSTCCGNTNADTTSVNTDTIPASPNVTIGAMKDTPSIEGTPAPYIQLLVCEKD